MRSFLIAPLTVAFTRRRGAAFAAPLKVESITRISRAEAALKLSALLALVLLSVAVPSFAQKSPSPTPTPSGFIPTPSICDAVAGNLVANCGFETGTFSSWTTTPAAAGSDFGIDSSEDGPHSGTHYASFGAVGALDDCISQALATTPGSTYKLDFWLGNDFAAALADFHVFWNGVDIFDASTSFFPYTEFKCSQVAAGRDILKFCGRQVPAWYNLDDVSVVLGAGGAAACSVATSCPDHTVHGHITTTPPDRHDGDSHAHAAQHGHKLLPGVVCLPPGHHVTVNGHILGMTPESADAATTPSALTPEPDFVAALNQDGLNAPAARGTVVQLFRSADGFFLDRADLRLALSFTPPVSGSPLYYTESLPEIQIGGIKAEVLFSGLAPGLKGVWQINVRIPEGVDAGKVPVTISYEGDALTSIDLTVE